MIRFGLQRRLACLAVCVGMSAFAAGDCYVVKRGQKIRGVALKAEANGTLKLQMEKGGPTQTFRRGDYSYGHVPKPKEVEVMENAMAKKSYDPVLKHGSSFFDKYKYLGWGDYISYMQGMAHMAREEYGQAQRIFERGMQYRATHEEDVIRGLTSAYVALKNFDKAEAILKKLMTSEDDKMAAFGFNTRGDILAAKGEKKDAMLDYLKTLLLFRPGKVDAERQKAKRQAVALLKELKDERWKEIAQID